MSGSIRLKGTTSGHVDLVAPASGGNVTINAAFIVSKDSANGTIQNLTTSEVAENANFLFYTDARVDSAIAGRFVSLSGDETISGYKTFSGNVGVATTESFQSGQKLAVGDGSSNSGMTVYSGTASQGRLYFASATTGAGQRAGQIYYDHSNNSMTVSTNGDNPRISVLQNGNVGIGTTDPDSKLHITGGINTGPATAGSTDAALIVSNADDAYGIHMNVAASTGNGFISAQRNDGTATGYDLVLQPNAGNVGIGIATPDEKLVVSGNLGFAYNTAISAYTIGKSADQYGLVYTSSVTSDATKIAHTFTSAANSNIMTMTYGGNVGIGETTPTEFLHISGAAPAVRLDNSSGTTDWLMQNVSNSMRWVSVPSAGGSSTERMRINSTGNVGIGEDNPSSNYVVRYAHVTDPTSAGYLCENSTGKWATYVNTSGAYDIRNETSGNLAMRIDTLGQVGIGMTAPSDRNLSLYGATNCILSMHNSTTGTTAASGLQMQGVGDNGYMVNYNDGGVLAFFTAETGNNTTERMRIDGTGNVFIGRTSAANAATNHGLQFYNTGEVYQFGSATGNSDLYRWYNGSGTKVAYLQGDGDLVITGTYSPSDERLKENIVDAPAGNIDDLKVRSFDWKADGEHQKYGFIAQELNSVAPYAVNEGETEEDMLAVNYAALVPMLVKEIQDLKLELQKIKDTI